MSRVIMLHNGNLLLIEDFQLFTRIQLGYTEIKLWNHEARYLFNNNYIDLGYL